MYFEVLSNVAAKLIQQSRIHDKTGFHKYTFGSRLLLITGYKCA